MLKILRYGLALAVLAAAVSVAQAQSKSDKGAPGTDAGNAAPKASTDDPNYLIGAQDMLNISVWKETELTQTVPVRPDGKISLPLLNDVQAAGLTPTQLATNLTESLKKFVTNPQVTVIVTQMNSQRIYITGEVNRAGAYPLLPGMTLLQGLSNAGGFTQFANTKKIYMLRTENGKQVRYPFNYKEIVSGKAQDQNVVMKAGDTIVVP
jgi:polysaccharide export outer membrane protein